MGEENEKYHREEKREANEERKNGWSRGECHKTEVEGKTKQPSKRMKERRRQDNNSGD